MNAIDGTAAQYEFPDRNIPDKEKGTQYVLQTIKAIHNRWLGFPNARYTSTGTMVGDTWNFYAAPFEMQRLRDFSAGLNTGDNQRKAHQLNDADANGAQTAMKVNWTPSKVQWKRMNAVSRFMYGRETELVATAIDPTSADRRMRERWRKIARISNASNPEVKQAAAMAGVDVSIPEAEPQTVEEFNIWEAMGPKDAESQSLTLAVALMHAASDYKNRVRKKLADELRDTGIGILAHEVSPAGLPYSWVVRVEDALLPWSEDNFRDMQYSGYIKWRTPEEVLSTVGSEWGAEGSTGREQKKKQLYQMARTGPCTDGRTYIDPMNNTLYNSRRGMVPVLTCFFKDVNHFPVSKRKGKSGEVYESGEKTGKWHTDRYEYEVVYKGNWIIGTHEGESSFGKVHCLHWKCGLAYNQPRMENELYKTTIPMTVRAYNMSNMRNRSVAAIARDKTIEIEELVIKIRDFIRKAIPPGILVDIDSLERTMESLSIPAETKMSHFIEMYQQSGSALFKTRDLADPTLSMVDKGQPLIPTPGAVGDIASLVAQLEWHKNDLDETLGLNDALLGNQTSERQSVGGLRIQAQGGSQALGFLFDTFDEIEAQGALVEYGLLQCCLQSGYVLEGMSKLMGDPAEKYIRFSAEDDPGSVGIEAVMHMTEEQQALMNESLNLAVSAGKIEVTDRGFILKAKNFDMAMQMLESRIRLRAKQAQENQKELVDRQTAGNQQAAQIQAQAAEKETAVNAELMTAITQLKGEMRLKEIQAKGQMDGDLKSQEMMVQMQETQLQLSAQIQQLQMKLDSQERVASEANATKREMNEENNETKEEVAAMKPKTAPK